MSYWGDQDSTMWTYPDTRNTFLNQTYNLHRDSKLVIVITLQTSQPFTGFVNTLYKQGAQQRPLLVFNFLNDYELLNVLLHMLLGNLNYFLT